MSKNRAKNSLDISIKLENPFIHPKNLLSQENTLLSLSSNLSTISSTDQFLKSSHVHSSFTSTNTFFKPFTLEIPTTEQKVALTGTDDPNSAVKHWYEEAVMKKASLFINEDRARDFTHDFIERDKFIQPAVLVPQVVEDKSNFPKVGLINTISMSIVTGGLSKDAKKQLGMFVEHCIETDPEFILKAALYCRKELNIRTTANLLIAIACFCSPTRPFVDKYFSACICLPSDWIEVAEYYKAISKNKGLPKVLRKNMCLKFTQFDDYQLGKHNKHKSRAKRARQAKSQGSSKCVSENSSESLTSRLVNSPKVFLTMKSLIHGLHISRPVFHVMCILGKKYPSSATDFVRLGLEGDWDPNSAGKRMRLPVPLTWETELSLNGNSAATWKELIVLDKLPYMALLRNIRNIIKVVSELQIHKLVLKKLADPRAVISSKQFPFRYFSAYKVLDQLHEKLTFSDYLTIILCDRVFMKLRKPLRCKWFLNAKNEREQKELLSKAKYVSYSDKLLKLYREALNEALEISVRHNLPPIPGSTLIFCCTSKLSKFEKVRESPLGTSIAEMGFLLATMCATICESATMYVDTDDPDQFVSFKDVSTLCDSQELDKSKANILGRAKFIYKNRKKANKQHILDIFEQFFVYHTRFDTIVVFGSCGVQFSNFVQNYRERIGPLQPIWSNLTGKDDQSGANFVGWVELKGCTDQVLRYIAETSDRGLLERVERIDELYGLNKPCRFPLRPQSPIGDENKELKQMRLKSEWRCCRLFISSTFRDMHGERDLICGLLIPALRQRVGIPNRVHINEVDLRWGVPEPATRSSQALRICLEQAAVSDLFILILGNRYGWIPKRELVDDLPPALLNEVNKFYKSGMSIVEMEYHMAKQSFLYRAKIKLEKLNKREFLRGHMMVYFRNSDCVLDVPAKYKYDFEEERMGKRQQLEKFKMLIRDDGVLIMNDYPATYAGVICHYPAMGNLTEFGDHLYNTIEYAILKLYKPRPEQTTVFMDLHKPKHMLTFLRVYVDPIASCISPRQLFSVEQAFDALTSRGEQVHAVRILATSQLSGAKLTEKSDISRLTYKGCDGSILLITGGSGSGKSTHISALAMTLSQNNWVPSYYELQRKSQMLPGKDELFLLKPVHLTNTIQRPKLPGYNVLLNYTNGLTLTGLTPRKRLALMLSDWIRRVLHDLEVLSKPSNLASFLVEKFKSSYEGNLVGCDTSTGNQDASFKSQLQGFLRLLTLLESFPEVRYAFMIDDLDYLEPVLLDWIPVVIPPNVRFVFTCAPKSRITNWLCSRSDCLVLTISDLTMAERGAAVRSLLGRYGKFLNETGFRNQLSVLTSKREANIPLYLKLACEELRLYAHFEDLDIKLRKLPETVHNFVLHVISRAELECGKGIVLATLGFLACARRPLSTVELHLLLDEWINDCLDRLPNENVRYPDSYSFLIHELEDLDKVTVSTTTEYLIRDILLYDKASTTSSWDYYGKSERTHYPPLNFYLLLNYLRPLISGLDSNHLGDTYDTEGGYDSNDFELDTNGAPKYLTRHKLSSWILDGKSVSLRSLEIQKIVYDICFNKASSRLSGFVRLGYYQPSSNKSQASFITENRGTKRIKPAGKPIVEPDPKYVQSRRIHHHLAITMRGIRDKIYYLFHAGEMSLVCRLLISPMFALYAIASGYGTTFLQDFDGFPTDDLELKKQWIETSTLPVLKDKLTAMKNFLATNYHYLVKYPFLFAVLALSEHPQQWIHEVGRVCLEFFNCDKSDETNELDFSRIKHILPLKSTKSGTRADIQLVRPVKIHKPVAAVSGITDAPTAVDIDINGNLLAYGTRSGTVTLMDFATLREIRSFYGHNETILSLCFIRDYSVSMELFGDGKAPGSQVWLVSTCHDSSIYIWNVSDLENTSTLYFDGFSKTTGYQLASLCGAHRRAVTSSAWHPTRRLLATGGLDCLVVLWELPKTENELKAMQSSTTKDTNPSICPFKYIKLATSPVNCVAFRLPGHTIADQQISESSCDVLAIGCWDGRVHLYSLVKMCPIQTIFVSNSSISSLAYLPGGGDSLATLDVRGKLLLWNSNTFTLRGGITQSVLDNNSSAIQSYQSGRICFSKPIGRYLIQAVENEASSGIINIWNSHLGAGIGPWFDTHRKTKAKHSEAHISYCGVIPLPCCIVTGCSDGIFELRTSKSNQVLFSSCSMAPPNNDTSTVQAIDCALLDRSSANLIYLIAVGWASGAVRFYRCMFTSQPNICISDMSKYLTSKDVKITEIYTGWSHSIGHSMNGIGDAGGALCVACSDDYVGASGGGNAECWVHFIDKTHSSSVMSSVCLTQHSSQVTCMSFHESLLATGAKNKVVIIYSVQYSSQLATPLTMINNAANDWVTALAWMSNNYSTSLFLLVGSKDQLIRSYSLDNGAFVAHQVIHGHASAITTLCRKHNYLACGYSDGHVQVWKLNEDAESIQFELVTTMNLQADWNQANLPRIPTSIINMRFSGLEQSPLVSDTVNDEANLSDSNMCVSMLFEDDMNQSIDVPDQESNIASVTDEEVLFRTLRQCAEGSNIYLLIGQEISVNNKSVIGTEVRQTTGFRFRTYAPLLPELRATLTGHPGLVACGLAAGRQSNLNADHLLVSVAGQSVEDSNHVGCDIRFWTLPAADELFYHKPLRHSGSVKCMAHARLHSQLSLCISGGLEGTVIFWLVFDRCPNNWAPLVCVLCHSAKLPIPVTRVVIQSVRTPPYNVYFIYVTCGPTLWAIKLQLRSCGSASEVQHILEQLFVHQIGECMTFEDLSNLWKQNPNTIDSIIVKYHLPHAIVDLCPINSAPNSKNECGVVAILTDGSCTLISDGTPSGASLPSLDCFRQISDVETGSGVIWPKSLCPLQNEVVCLIQGNVFRINYNESKNPTILSAFNIPVESIHPITLTSETETVTIYAATTSIQHGNKIIVSSLDKQVFLTFSPVSKPSWITTCCIVPDSVLYTNGSWKFSIFTATSDGFLRLFECIITDLNDPAASRWRQAGLYPIGEKINEIMAICDNPVKIMVGSESGEITFYSVM